MIIKNKRFFRAVLLIVIMIIISVELPYSDKAIFQHIVLFFTAMFSKEVSNFVTIFWGLPLLVGWVWSFYEIAQSKKLKVNGVILFFVMFMVLIPITEKGIDVVKRSIYLMHEGVDSIEVRDSSLFISDFDQEYEAHLRLDLKYPDQYHEKVRVRLSLPDETKEFFKTTSFMLVQEAESYSDDIAIFRSNTKLEIIQGCDLEELSRIKMEMLDYEIVLIYELEERRYVRNDSY